MKKVIYPLLVLGLTSSVSANLFTYDGFDEPVSPNAPTNWLPDAGDGASSLHGEVVSGSLSYTGLQDSVGNSFGLANRTADYNYDVPDVTLAVGETVYFSFLLQSNVADTSWNGNFRLFNDPDIFGNAISVGWGSANADDTNMGFSLNNRNRNYTHADSIQTGENYSQTGTHLVVASFTLGSGNTNGELSLWINPSSATFGTSTPPTADVTIASYQAQDTYTSFEIVSNGSGSFPSDWQMDEFRVATDWADVVPATVPEPSVYALMVGLLSMLVVARRRLSAAK
ncbi:PEP-CTERM sorting domain-containing protein [Cerasicoccus fimbriatus]|uniref:PEP-CTERM sorting domain-containing protein n=1 Tax=Cerasicoccus fimbriatus TaxID=3014554 RepID=UPI0022B3F4E1|nr:PEP-CTERM sorting domain-containing protein [Cerasicoccus sp. TK19100]